jgi:hypothetical protein
LEQLRNYFGNPKRSFYASSSGKPQMEGTLHMPKSTEFVIQLENRPGTFGKVGKALGDKGVNIVAFESFSEAGNSGVRFVVDNAAATKTVLDNQRVTYKENEVAQVSLPNRPGELGRAASQLGEANINMNTPTAELSRGRIRRWWSSALRRLARLCQSWMRLPRRLRSVGFGVRRLQRS